MSSNPELISSDRSSLLVVDVQEKLLPVISNKEEITKNLTRLLETSQLFSVSVIFSEQYPQGLGKTADELLNATHSIENLNRQPDRLSSVSVFEKTTFSCIENLPFFTKLLESGKDQLVLTGIESHICVTQSCLDLSQLGFQVFVVSDAIGSRNPDHTKLALARLSIAGIPAIPTESVLFEWCRSADHPAFKKVSRMIRNG